MTDHAHPFRAHHERPGRDRRQEPADARDSLRTNPFVELNDETIRKYCRRILLSRGHHNAEHDALDARQDFYVKLLSGGFDNLDPSRKPDPFAYASLRNLCMDQLRKKLRRPVDRLEIDLPERHENVGTSLVSTERRVELRRAMLKLPARERRLLLAVYWLQWPRERIAERLQIAPTTVPALACRIRSKLRTLLGSDFMDDVAA